MKNVLLYLVLGAAAAFASASEIHIAEKIPYQDESRINHRIVSECTEIGTVLSESVVKHAAAKGLNVVRSAAPENQAVYAKIEIESAISAGSAFIGHWKGISLSTTLYQDGRETAQNSFKRNSTGGMFGGFKGSCSVLYRTANVLGKDIAGWLASQNRP